MEDNCCLSWKAPVVCAHTSILPVESTFATQACGSICPCMMVCVWKTFSKMWSASRKPFSMSPLLTLVWEQTLPNFTVFPLPV